jgi:hypothetical protein
MVKQIRESLQQWSVRLPSVSVDFTELAKVDKTRKLRDKPSRSQVLKCIQDNNWIQKTAQVIDLYKWMVLRGVLIVIRMYVSDVRVLAYDNTRLLLIASMKSSTGTLCLYLYPSRPLAEHLLKRHGIKESNRMYRLL